MSLAVWLGSERKCSATAVWFRYAVRVIYGAAVFINILKITAVALNQVELDF